MGHTVYDFFGFGIAWTISLSEFLEDDE